MKRIGYDADSSRYIFRDRDGSLWQGPEGSEYGEMNRGLFGSNTLPYLIIQSHFTNFSLEQSADYLHL